MSQLETFSNYILLFSNIFLHWHTWCRWTWPWKNRKKWHKIWKNDSAQENVSVNYICFSCSRADFCHSSEKTKKQRVPSQSNPIKLLRSYRVVKITKILLISHVIWATGQHTRFDELAWITLMQEDKQICHLCEFVFFVDRMQTRLVDRLETEWRLKWIKCRRK